jgi:hypothetical protein
LAFTTILLKRIEPVTKKSSDQTEAQQRNQRIAAISGLIYMALIVIATINFMTQMFPHMPAVGSDPSEFFALYSEHGALIRTTNYLFALPVPVFLFFIAALYAILRRAEPEGVFAMAALAGGLTMMSPWLRNLVVETSAVDIAGMGGDPAVIAAFDSFGPMTYSLGGLPRAVLLFATSAIILRSGLAPRWIGWFGYVAAVISVLGSITFANASAFPATMVGLLVSGIWLLALSASLLRAPQSVLESVTASAPA